MSQFNFVALYMRTSREMSKRTTKPTIRLVRPAKTQISSHIRAVWSETRMRLLQPQNYLKKINENSCQTGWIYRLIYVFATCTGLIVGFVLCWLIQLNNNIDVIRTKGARLTIKYRTGKRGRHLCKQRQLRATCVLDYSDHGLCYFSYQWPNKSKAEKLISCHEFQVVLAVVALKCDGGSSSVPCTYSLWAEPSEIVSSSMSKMQKFRLTPCIRKSQCGDLFSIDTFLFLDSKGPDQTARMRRLLWTFAVRICPKTYFRMAWPLKCLR